MPIEHINKTDTLHEGREKLNAAIDRANAADVTSKAADTKATQALANSESTQTQLDTIVIDGDSSVEAAQARVDEKGDPHPTLKARIDDGFEKTNQQLAETNHQQFIGSLVNRKEPIGLYITWTDDDGTSEVYERMLPLMEYYNIPMTSAIIPDRILNSSSGYYLSPEQVRELIDAGMEILSHTNAWDSSDRPVDWSEEELDADFRLSQEQVKQLGGNSKGLVLPYGDNTPLIQRVARRYYDFVVGTGATNNPLSGRVLYPGEIDNY